MEKICSKCKIKKSFKDFHKRLDSKDGYKSQCKDCINFKSREWYAINKDYYNEAKKQYRKNNREKINKKFNEYYNKRVATDNNFKLVRNIRSLIRGSYKRCLNSKLKKSNKTELILGCSLNCFINHIESLFKPNMSFDNYGEWELDHIIPISLAKDGEEIIKLNHYTNFQPLWKEENRKKKNKINY